MHGAPKRIRFYRAHPSRGLRNPTPGTPNALRNESIRISANLTHTDPLTGATQKPRHPRPHTANLTYSLP